MSWGQTRSAVGILGLGDPWEMGWAWPLPTRGPSTPGNQSGHTADSGQEGLLLLGRPGPFPRGDK